MASEATGSDDILPRGGGGKTPEKETSVGKKALASIQFAAMASLGSAAMDAAAAWIGHILPNTSSPEVIPTESVLSIVQSFEAVDFFYRISFGFGLVAVSKFYAKVLQEGNDKTGILSKKEIFNLSSIMSLLWGGGALILSLESFVGAVLLKEDVSYNPMLQQLVGPASIGALLVAVLAAVGFSFSSTERGVSKKYTVGSWDDKNDINPSVVRSRGFMAARNMAFTTGALYVVGVLSLLGPLLKPLELLERVFGLSDVYEVVVYVQLLRALNRSFLVAIAQATDGKIRPAESISPLYEAQDKFYRKLGNTYLFTSGFQLLLPLYSAIKFLIGA